jgi:hypothetical protein
MALSKHAPRTVNFELFSYSFDWRRSVLTLIVILINVGILFYYFLFERNVIYWSGLVQRRDLTPKYCYEWMS